MIGHNVAKLRKERNMTQVELADRLGVQQTIISRIERNEATVSLERAVHLAQILDVSIHDLYRPVPEVEPVYAPAS